MRVYRVEHQEHRYGPYAERVVPELWRMAGDHNEDDAGHPGGRVDFEHVGIYFRFGFTSLEDLKVWFKG